MLEPRVDHGRVVDIVRRAGQLPLVKDYLLSVQKTNLVAVNEAVNELLIDEEDFDGLKQSIVTYDNFDQLSLAARLEKHELTEFRRIAAFIYKRNLRWKKAVELAKQDKLYKDAMETVAQSEDKDLAEELLKFFVEQQEKECFAAQLFTCYDLIKPDVALEVAWVNGLMDMVMPYLVQFLRDYSGKVDMLMVERAERREKEQADENAQKQQEAASNAYLTLMPLALPAPPTAPAPDAYGQPSPYGYGAPQF